MTNGTEDASKPDSVKRRLDPVRFLTADETRRVEEAIADAERQTSAEIKLVLVKHCWFRIEEKASAIFKNSGLENTRDRNAVMIFLVIANREFLIHGDQGIHEKVGGGFWKETSAAMLTAFKQNRFGDGLVDGIHRIGRQLKEFFPLQAGDKNEISNRIQYGEKK